jgi:membrane protease YdiL (CAAX protease family)
MLSQDRATSLPIAPVRWRRVIIYYALVYAASYGLVGGFLLTGGSFRDPGWVFFAQVSSLTPALVALGLTRWLWHAPLSSSLGLRLRADRWLLLAWLLPWALALLALGFALAVPGTRYDGTLQPAVDRTLVSQAQLTWLRQLAARAALPPIALLVPLGLLSSVTMSFVAGCGEENGWRGFLHTELRALGFWRNALVTGLFWLGWHLPLLALGYGYPRHPVLGILAMAAHILITSVGYAYLRDRAASSVVVGLFHGTTEATALLAVAPIRGRTDLLVGIGSLSWTAAVAVVVCALLVHDRFVAREPIAWRRRG